MSTQDSATIDPQRRRRTRKVRRLFWVLGSVTALAHIPLALGVAAMLNRCGLPRAGMVGTVIAGVALLLFPLLVPNAYREGRRSRWKTRCIDVPYLTFWCSTLLHAVFSSAVGLVCLVGMAFSWALPFSVSSAFIASLFASGAIAVYAVYVRARWVRVQHIHLSLKGLPKAFDGFRIAHLSDLHIGNFWPSHVAMRWVKMTQALGPDLVVLTGDLVVSRDAFHKDAADALRAMHAPCGVLAVLGNHDCLGDPAKLSAVLERAGVQVLRNTSIVVDRGDGKLVIAGVDDPTFCHADIKGALAATVVCPVTIMLAHDPDLFPQIADEGVSLVLSGHTHGGQFAVPFCARWLNLTKLSHRYHYGLYRRGASTLIVHAGLGTTGPPARLGVPPEIVMIHLSAS